MANELERLFAELHTCTWAIPVHRTLTLMELDDIALPMNGLEDLGKYAAGTIFGFPALAHDGELRRKTRITADQIKSRLTDGWTIYILDLVDDDCEFARQLKNLADQYLLASPRISLFAAKHGAAMPMHWDNTINITYQILGEKEWRIARNRNISYPSENYSETDAVYRPTGKQYNPAEEDIECLTLKAGEILFLPRGYWHATETNVPESISISLNFKPFTISNYIRNYLEQQTRDLEFFQKEIRTLKESDLRPINQILKDTERALAQLQGAEI